MGLEGDANPVELLGDRCSAFFFTSTQCRTHTCIMEVLSMMLSVPFSHVLSGD